jgi:carboxyl-terminal processing protease
MFTARGRDADAEAKVSVDQRYYREANTEDVLASLPAWARTVPLTVLVNGASASAAELLAGALQDNHRAAIVGSQTFGKGSIQSVMPLDEDEGIKFTVARYFTPDGHEIQARGVTPDLVVQAGKSADDEPQLREADLANHLPPTQDTVGATAQRAIPESTRMFGTRDDKALQAAVRLLAPGARPGSALAGMLRKWTRWRRAKRRRGGAP